DADSDPDGEPDTDDNQDAGNGVVLPFRSPDQDAAARRGPAADPSSYDSTHGGNGTGAGPGGGNGSLYTTGTPLDTPTPIGTGTGLPAGNGTQGGAGFGLAAAPTGRRVRARLARFNAPWQTPQVSEVLEPLIATHRN